jgi:glucan phosphoethanolaminetransferase (alkaline phosphatase superfamily)
LLNLLLFTVGESVATALVIIATVAFGLVFWLTKGIAFGYTRSKLSENTRSTLLTIHLIFSIILALALPNNYLISFPFFESLYNQNEFWIPVSMFVLLIMFVTFFGLCLSLIFEPSKQEDQDSDPNPDNSEEVVYHSGRFRPITLVLVATGAFLFWTLSGFHGSFNHHMSRYTDSDNKYDRNFFAGLIIFVLLVTTVSRIIA